MPIISNAVHPPDHEIELNTTRAQGAGGRNVNKVSSVVHLHFDIQVLSLPLFYKERLLALNDRRISGDGVVVIETQQRRTQEQDREDALERLAELTRNVIRVQKARCPTKFMRGSQKRRLDGKTKHSAVKVGRGKMDF